VLARAANILDQPRIRAAATRALRLAERLVAVDAEAKPGLAEIAFTALAISEGTKPQKHRRTAERLGAAMTGAIGAHGRIAAPGDTDDSAQDFVPGQVMLALAALERAGLVVTGAERLALSFRFYRHRFRHLHKSRAGQLCWLTQAFSAWWRLAPRAELAASVFEMIDWALDSQLSAGGFLCELQSDPPGCSTAVMLEGVAAAHGVARATGDFERSSRYLDSYRRGMAFLGRLVYRKEDVHLLPNPHWALGGIRYTPYRSEVRTDFVQHALNAVLDGPPMLAAEPNTPHRARGSKKKARR
jgi:hypothetical protein